jgi:AmpE protein
MTFIVTLIALLIERFFDWSHLRRWEWYAGYQRFITQKVTGKSPYLVLAMVMLPLLVGVGIVQFAIKGWVYGLISLLFQLFILLYCLGPRNLWADGFATINAMQQGDAAAAQDKLKHLFGATDTQHSLLTAMFVEANHRVFACVFWYVVLGPVGAVLYRAISLLAKNENAAPQLHQIVELLDWLPARLLTFIFALGGNFVQVLSCWRKKVLLGLASNHTLLADCGEAALGADAQSADGVIVESHAISLLDRTFVITLVLVAVVVLMG